MQKKLKQLSIIEVQHLCYHLHCSEKFLRSVCKDVDRFYRTFSLQIGDKKRQIAHPIGHLDRLLRNLLKLLKRIEMPPYLHGGIKGRSPKTNAVIHIGKAAVLNFDIQDFFPSIKPHHVYHCFVKQMGCSPDIAWLITRLVTHEGCIPQGSPTSTVIANLVIIPLAKRISSLAAHHDCDYTQFVDDGALSGRAYIERLRPLIDRIIQQEGFKASPKPHKRTTRYRNEEQLVTGIKVNWSIDVPSEYVKHIREEIVNYSDMSSLASLRGKVRYVSSLNPKTGNMLNGMLIGKLS